MPDGVSPDVTVRGPGEDPELTIVGGVHGDEPSGVRAIDRILDDVGGVAEGTLTSHATAVTVEAGCQHSDAATETATEMVEAFLQRHDALPGDPFVPILMSECGYQSIFGYRGHRVGETVAAAREEWNR